MPPTKGEVREYVTSWHRLSLHQHSLSSAVGVSTLTLRKWRWENKGRSSSRSRGPCAIRAVPWTSGSRAGRSRGKKGDHQSAPRPRLGPTLNVAIPKVGIVRPGVGGLDACEEFRSPQ